MTEYKIKSDLKTCNYTSNDDAYDIYAADSMGNEICVKVESTDKGIKTASLKSTQRAFKGYLN